MINFPTVTQADIDAVKRLSRSDRDELKARINATDPHNIFTPAGTTSNADKRKIICPICGNGSGHDHTPVEVKRENGVWLYNCFKNCGFSGDLLKIIADNRHLNLNVGSDFNQALAIGAALIGYFVPQGDYITRQPPKQSASAQVAEPTKPAPEYERLAEARKNLVAFIEAQPDKKFRGLPLETYLQLNWGYLPDFNHPNPDDKVTFPALIIPNDKGGIFARRVKGKDYRNISPTATTTIVLPTADMYLFIVEGAIDGASVAYVTDFAHGVIAIGGTSGTKALIERLQELFPEGTPKPKLILMLDNDAAKLEDNPGQKTAAKLLPKLRELGFVVVKRVICDVPRRDPNKILMEDGEDALRGMIEKIIADAAPEFAELEADKSRRAAEVKSQQSDPPRTKTTTKDKIADCPVDLIIPHNVIFDAQGITLMESRGEGKPPRYLTAATTPIVPTKILRDEKSGLVQYELAILTQGKWRRHVVDGRTIQSARCIDKLANFGALIKPSPLCEYFTRIIAANDDRLPTCRVFAQPGWYSDKFQHFVYPTGGQNYVVDRAGYNFKADYAERGDADKWLQVFGDAMTAGGRIARIFVGVAVAAPLIRPLKIDNMQIHIFGFPDTGKTVLTRLSASIFGNPQELLRTFETSPKRRQADAAANNDLPTFNDELETVRGQRAEMSLTQSVYAFYSGVGNQNLNIDGTARDTFKFTGSRLSTGERQILKLSDQYGAYKRLVQLECRGKIFNKNLATEIHRLVLDNFGHFGRAWTTYIAGHLSEIRATYEAKERALLADETREETQLRTICAAGVAYQFFALHVGLQDSFDAQQFQSDVSATIEELPTVEESHDSTRALDVLRDTVASNEDRFYLETNLDPRREYEPKAHGEHWGKLFLNGEVAINPTVLRQILSKADFSSPDMLINTWHGEDKLITGDGRNTKRIRIGGARSYMICFKAGELSDQREDREQPRNDKFPPP